MGLDQLAHLRIVLVEPAGPRNVGSVARVMANMGLRHLVLVNPQCDPTSAEAVHMAVHGQAVLAAAQVVNTLPDALVGCHRAAATTGRIHPQHHGLETPEAVLPWLLPQEAHLHHPTALIFGPEDRGLSNEELIYAQRWIRIPASATYPSLNLAQAVAVCSYLLHRQAEAQPGFLLEGSPPSSPVPKRPVPSPRSSAEAEAVATLDQIEGFHQDLETILLKIGYLYPHTAASRMAKLRQLLHRAEPNSQELAMLRGVLRQVNWAITHGPRSS
ncbi:RNA methyltransferase [Leptolyngbya sp. BL0902]|uniref:RNA methyltransferase n=1 Tax=Leptolyngbya sp. BL0902 TaxID=1115757 RepID=UPI0018E90355|nr:RNA methyltransferase [Leptolyngbya sp. BL0902]QQE65779.1 RNA methyltransferase [Leptolyngbya sp. BL0902]